MDRKLVFAVVALICIVLVAGMTFFEIGFKQMPPTTTIDFPVEKSTASETSPNGFYDVQCSGKLQDFCRHIHTADSTAFFSCALSGTGLLYTQNGLYSPIDFDSNRVFKGCTDKNYSPASKAINNEVKAVVTNKSINEVKAVDVWQRVTYSTTTHPHGYDAHEPTAGSPLSCLRDGDLIKLRGSLQCLGGQEDCFLRPELDLASNPMINAATLPTACRPDQTQHMYMMPAIYDKIMPWPGSLVRLFPNGSIFIEMDHGTSQWTMLLDNQSSIGEGKSLLPVEATHVPQVSTKVVNVAKPRVGIGVPMTSRGMKTPLTQVESSILWRIALRGLKRLLTTDLEKFDVTLYAGYDNTDPYWPKLNPQDKSEGNMKIRFIECDCASMVCNSNCIMRVAYEAGSDYFFRINDDSELKNSPNFLSKFVSALGTLDPPNLGVVGPLCNEGKTTILTHDFVHRSHMEIFGMNYYPPELANWWCDDWISLVYGNSRKKVLRDVPLRHHLTPKRYNVDTSVLNNGTYTNMLRRTRILASAVVRNMAKS